MTDTGHILDTGGVDTAACSTNQNESLAWRAIGTVGVGSTTANLLLTASTATAFPAANTPATIVANLKDAANILPLANVTAHFQVLSGPNTGLSGQGLTDSHGHTTFTYTSTVAGTDVLTASVTNASNGVLSSNPVTITWTTPGTIAWHPHKTVRLSDGLSASVDLYDGHVDVAADDLSLPTRGPDLALGHVWDSDFAETGLATSVGQSWLSSLTPRLGGVLTGTVLYTDTSGAVWPFAYTGNPTAPPPYTTYQTPSGLPWQLTTSTAGYTLTHVLSSEALTFDNQGRYLSDTDAYGNHNVLSYGASGPISETNSGGRALSLAYTNGLLSRPCAPLSTAAGR